MFVWVRPEWSLLYATVSGVGEVLIDGVWQHCEAGSAYLAPEGQVFGYRKIPRADWQAVWVTLSDSTLRVGEPPRLVRADPSYLLHAVQGLFAEDSGRREPSLVESYASLIAAHTQRIAQGSAQLSVQLRHVWEQVRRDLSHPWTSLELAALACISESTLRRLCQSVLGRSPLEQVAFLRMRHATSLLMTTDLSVGEIAEQVGYSNPLAFSTAFKRVMGVPPTHARSRKLTR